MMRDDFLSRVHAILRDAASSFPGGAIKGSIVGTLLRARGIDPATHGYEKIRDLMNALELAGKVKTGADGKLAYTVWVLEAAEQEDRRTSTTTASSANTSLVGRSGDDDDLGSVGRYLRQPVYDAFVNERLPHPRKIGRTSGSLWVGDVPQPSSDAEWVDIQQIAAPMQRGWALRFLVQKGWESEPELVAALHADDWYKSFPQTLAVRHGEAALKGWNRRRTAKVMDEVDRWATERSFPISLLYAGQNAPVDLNADARKRILDVLARLPTSELLKLPIPARFWISAMRGKGGDAQ